MYAGGATVLPVWLEVICSDLILLFLPLVGPLSSWWGVGVFLLLNKPHYLDLTGSPEQGVEKKQLGILQQSMNPQ